MRLQLGKETAPTLQGSTVRPQRSDEGFNDQNSSSEDPGESYINNNPCSSVSLWYNNAVSVPFFETRRDETTGANLVGGTTCYDAKASLSNRNECFVKYCDNNDQESVNRLMKRKQCIKPDELVDENPFSVTEKSDAFPDDFADCIDDNDAISLGLEDCWIDRDMETPVDAMDLWRSHNPRTGIEPDPAGPPKKKVRFQPPLEPDPIPSSRIDDTTAWLEVSKSNTTTTTPVCVNRGDVLAQRTFTEDVESRHEDTHPKIFQRKRESAPAYFFTTAENTTEDIRGDLHYLGVELDGWIDMNIFESVSVYRQELQGIDSTCHFATGFAQLQTRLDDPGVFRLILNDCMMPQCILVVALVPGTCIHSPPGGGLTIQVRNYTAGSACPLEFVIIQAPKTTIDQMHVALRQAIAQSVF